MKVSSVRKKSVKDFIQWIDYRYRGSGKLIMVTQGKKHDYLGILLDFTEDGVVAVGMAYYVGNMLKAFPTKFKKTETAATPSNEKIFMIDKSKPLDKTRAEKFHTIVAKEVFLCKRERPDIQPTIAAL